jgi:hypothetical protein
MLSVRHRGQLTASELVLFSVTSCPGEIPRRGGDVTYDLVNFLGKR